MRFLNMLGKGAYLSACLTLAAGAALAEDARDINIPPQALGPALDALARQTGLRPVYADAAVRGASTAGAAGHMTPREALAQLLAGTGLSYAFTGRGAVAIKRGKFDGRSVAEEEGVPLPEVDVAGTASGFGGAGPAQDPYSATYVLEDAATGTKTNTPIMDTPLNIQVITQQVLRDQQVISLDQALQNVSGVTVAGPGALGAGTAYSQIVLRGFPTWTLFRDGFRQDTTVSFLDGASTQQLANVASIEVLKGPAAMLYGLVEPGGIVNIITKEPLTAPYYSVNQQIGSFANFRTSVDATGPVTKDGAWLYRMNMSYQNNGAPFGSPVDLTHSQDIFLAPVLKWNIDPETWVKLEAQYDENRFGQFYGVDPVFNGAFMPIPRSRNYGGNSPAAQKSLFSALTWSHQFDSDWSIKQQISYNRIAYSSSTIQPYAFETVGGAQLIDRYLATNATGQTTYSTNVDIIGHIDTFGAAHTLLIGGDVYKSTVLSEVGFNLGPSQIDLFNPVHPGTPFPGSLTPASGSNSVQDTAGLYLQDQIKLPYNFYLLAGARYQYIHQASEAGPTLGEMTQSPPLTESALTPRFGLLWRPESWVSFYANYSEGFGPNSATLYPGIPAPPTSAREGEAGVKLEFFDGRLRASADYYDLTKTNIPTADPSPFHQGFSILTGEARSKGVELDIQGTISPGWNVIVAYANQDVRITKSEIGDVGQRLPNIPRNLGSFWTTYEFQQQVLTGWKVGGGVIYHGSQPIVDYSGLNLSPSLPMLSAYATVNLMAAYSFKVADAKITAQVNVTNLLDATFYTGAINYAPVSPGFALGVRTYGAPRAIMGSLSAQF
jgi:iron complex outermembrane receptor protein